jgi:hypothetical protein
MRRTALDWWGAFPRSRIWMQLIVMELVFSLPVCGWISLRRNSALFSVFRF